MSRFKELLKKRNFLKNKLMSLGTTGEFNFDDLPDLDSLSPEERSILIEILQEFSDEGKSETLLNIWKQDYDEIPVDIETFIRDPKYLGKSTNEGKAIYPFWIETLKDIYSPGAKYWEVVLSGAIGIGKTTVSNIGISYMLHRLLCLKDPQSYYGLTPGSKIVIAFFNVTLDLSRGVAFNNLQSMLKESKWFLDRGMITGRIHPIYNPGKNIDFRVGSTDRHGLGQDIFCLFRGTKIVTTEGSKNIEELVEKDLYVYSYKDNGDIVISDKCTVKESGYSDEVVEVELENSVIVKCTPEHRWLVGNGNNSKYVFAKDIKEGDNIISTGFEVEMIPVESSNVDSVGYDPYLKEIYVEFKNGSLYKYFDVEKSEFQGLKEASSIGRHLNSKIKGVKNYKKISS